MRARVNVRCPTCGWYTSRTPRADGDYGACRCGGLLYVVPRRHYFRRAAPPLKPAPTRDPDPSATWPELVAAELDRRQWGS